MRNARSDIMSYTENRREYLDKKYSEIEDAPIEGKPSKRHPPKKSVHRHRYENCILRWDDDSWITYDEHHSLHRVTKTIHMLASYCIDCGKIGEYDRSDPFYRKIGMPLIMMIIPKESLEEAKSRYPVFDVSGYQDKFVSR